MIPSSDVSEETDDRGEKYADGGIATNDVFYPDPERIRAISEEWAKRADPN